jgi:formylmethanofuran dehydrogenase subunit E
MPRTHSRKKVVSEIKPFEKAVEFHGHVCPGLAIGYRAAEVGLKSLACDRDLDEELVAIVENDACGVDAIQVVTGCTIGKGNLILKDHGKQVYTFIGRESEEAVRISLRETVDSLDPVLGRLRGKVTSGSASAEESAEFGKRMGQAVSGILAMPGERLFDVRQVKADIPEKARIFKSVKCSKCGEMVSEARARVRDGVFVCIPCYGGYSCEES